MNDDPQNPLFRRGIPVSLTALRRMHETVGALSQGTVGGDLGAVGTVGEDGFQLATDSTPGMKGLWVQITGQNASFPSVYSFTAVLEAGADSVPNDITFNQDPAYLNYGVGFYNAKEVNGNANVPINSLVWIVPAVGVSTFWEFSYTPGVAFIKPTTTSSSTISLGRTITDGVLISGSPTLTSATANFTVADTGSTVIGSGIPSSTTITIIDATTATMSHNATVTTTGVTVVIQSGTVTGYAAELESWSNVTGAWSDGATVWFVGANAETPTSGTRYLCKQIGVDASGVAIWAQQIGSDGGGIEIIDKSFAVVENPCAVFQMDTDGVITATHFALNVPSTGNPDRVQISVTDASPTQRGVVNTGNQHFGGNKWFDNRQIQIGPGGNSSTQVITNTFPDRFEINFVSASGTGGGNLYINNDGNVTIFGGIAAPGDCLLGSVASTSATTGFVYFPTCAGVPTGIPIDGDGAAVVNSSTGVLYVYTSATGWKAQ